MMESDGLPMDFGGLEDEHKEGVMRVCTHCGHNESDPDARFCRYCGTLLSKNQPKGWINDFFKG